LDNIGNRFIWAVVVARRCKQWPWIRGSNGGGIVYIISGGNISGSGTINANGADADSSTGEDAPGGAGGGGTVILYTKCATISNLTINAVGGKGGDQDWVSGSGESEGPGGGVAVAMLQLQTYIFYCECGWRR